MMKQVPDKNILLFKSCLVSVEYPGIESSTKFVFDKISNGLFNIPLFNIIIISKSLFKIYIQYREINICNSLF